jgi:hypothetical protein
MKFLIRIDESRRNPNWTRLGLAIALAVALAATGCMVPKTAMEIEKPRKFSATTPLRTVVILPFEGRHSGPVGERFREMVADTRVRGRDFFSVVDPHRLENVRREVGRVQSGKFQRRDLARIREQTGALGIFSGSVTEAKVKDSSYREPRQRCMENENTWRGVLLRKCEAGKLEEVQEVCTKREVRFTFVPRLLAVESGRVVGSQRGI